MADDLVDQWEVDAPVADDDAYDSVAVSLPGDVKKGAKRKAFNEAGQPKKVKGDQNVKTEKVKKKRERRKITEMSQEVLSKSGTPKDVGSMMSRMLKGKMSAEALQDCLPDPATDFYPCNTDTLPASDYLTSIIPNWRALVKKSLHFGKNGSPSVLVVTSSAIRAVNLIRDLKTFTGEKCKVAKLFSKHIKIEEQKRFLTKGICQIGVGTPNRLLALIKLGVLQTESLVSVVLDWNWRDTKMKRLPDIPDIQQDLTMLLKDYLMEVVQGSPCRLALL